MVLVGYCPNCNECLLYVLMNLAIRPRLDSVYRCRACTFEWDTRAFTKEQAFAIFCDIEQDRREAVEKEAKQGEPNA